MSTSVYRGLTDRDHLGHQCRQPDPAVVDGEREASFVRTMIALAHSLGDDVVAEGIERTEQHARLKELGCHIGQGFVFSKPMDINDALV